MAIFALVSGILFCLVGVYGGMCSLSRWARGCSGYFIFEPIGASFFGVTALVAFVLFMSTVAALEGPLLFLMIAAAPFGVLGTVLWGFGFALEMGRRFFVSDSGTVAVTYDKGDGLLARGLFAEAEAEYRAALQCDNLDINALLRVARALEGAGKAREAAEELAAAHREYSARRNGPPFTLFIWQQHILRVTYALGDVLVDRLGDRVRARQLYEQTLEILYGCKETDGLRERIRLIDRMPGNNAPAVELADSVPEKLSL